MQRIARATPVHQAVYAGAAAAAGEAVRATCAAGGDARAALQAGAAAAASTLRGALGSVPEAALLLAPPEGSVAAPCSGSPAVPGSIDVTAAREVLAAAQLRLSSQGTLQYDDVDDSAAAAAGGAAGAVEGGGMLHGATVPLAAVHDALLWAIAQHQQERRGAAAATASIGSGGSSLQPRGPAAAAAAAAGPYPWDLGDDEAAGLFRACAPALLALLPRGALLAVRSSSAQAWVLALAAARLSGAQAGGAGPPPLPPPLPSPWAALLEPPAPGREPFAALVEGIAAASAELSLAAAPGALWALADMMGAARAAAGPAAAQRMRGRGGGEGDALEQWALAGAVAADTDALLTGRLSLGDSANGDTRLRLAELLPSQVPPAEAGGQPRATTLGELEAHLHARYAAVVTRGGPEGGGGGAGALPPPQQQHPLRRVLSQQRRPFLGDDASAALAEGPREGLLVSFGWAPGDAL